MVYGWEINNINGNQLVGGQYEQLDGQIYSFSHL